MKTNASLWVAALAAGLSCALMAEDWPGAGIYTASDPTDGRRRHRDARPFLLGAAVPRERVQGVGRERHAHARRQVHADERLLHQDGPRHARAHLSRLAAARQGAAEREPAWADCHVGRDDGRLHERRVRARDRGRGNARPRRAGCDEQHHQHDVHRQPHAEIRRPRHHERRGRAAQQLVLHRARHGADLQRRAGRGVRPQGRALGSQPAEHRLRQRHGQRLPARVAHRGRRHGKCSLPDLHARDGERRGACRDHERRFVRQQLLECRGGRLADEERFGRHGLRRHLGIVHGKRVLRQSAQKRFSEREGPVAAGLRPHDAERRQQRARERDVRRLDARLAL